MPKILNQHPPQKTPAGKKAPTSKGGQSLARKGGLATVARPADMGTSPSSIRVAKPADNRPVPTNRGPAGSRDALTEETRSVADAGRGWDVAPKKEVKVQKNNINPGLKELTVPIPSLQPDPKNARLHPEKNLEAIKLSLSLYGQVKPLVVVRELVHEEEVEGEDGVKRKRKKKLKNVVIAGNGTMEGAKQLGWDKIAATFVEMDAVEAAGYGLADNRTAELAKWDFETVARLQKLVEMNGHHMVGWTDDELIVLRMADWTPPEQSDQEFGSGGSPGERLTMTFDVEQRDVIDEAIATFHSRKFAEMGGEEGEAELNMTEAECLVEICRLYIGGGAGE